MLLKHRTILITLLVVLNIHTRGKILRSWIAIALALKQICGSVVGSKLKGGAETYQKPWQAKKKGGASVGVMYNFAEKDPPVPTPMCGSATYYYIWHTCICKKKIKVFYVSIVYFLIPPFCDDRVYCKADIINW